MTGEPWSPGSWRGKPNAQEMHYPDEAELAGALEELRHLPPLVTSWEVERLRVELAEAAHGRRFLLQGGDCAERFGDCEETRIVSRLKTLLKMSVLLVHGGGRPVTRVGRIAGQYAKPRSEPTETRDGVTLPSYRGQLYNWPGFTPEDRTPDPRLLVRAYQQSALTLNFIRSLTDGGFADLHQAELWNLTDPANGRLPEECRTVAETVKASIRMTENLLGRPLDELKRVAFYTSHEGLNLHYEEAKTRRVPRRAGWYDLTTHFPWIGERTRALGGAHVEFFRGLANPIGVKVGPSMGAHELVELVRTLDPSREPGRLTLIHRFGASRIASALPPLVEAVRREHADVLWCCDPMHGNTFTTATGVKTRRFDDVVSEVEQAFEIHAALGSRLGGVHLELTGEPVTECVGGPGGLCEEDLSVDYRSEVDPRLNDEQSMELAFRIARHVGRG